jgi:hypothetical protein
VGLMVIAAIVVAFVVWQTTGTEVVAKQTVKAEQGAPEGARAIEVRPPIGGHVERAVQRLAQLSELGGASKDGLVEAAGLIVDIVDKAGVPFRVTIADSSGFAEVVSFTPSEELKSRILGAECLRLDARVTTYRGDFQLEPVAFSLVRTGSAKELGFPSQLHPQMASRFSELREGAIVRVDGKLLSATPTRSGGGFHGEMALSSGDRVRFLWSDPPEELARATSVRAYARVGAYEQKPQLRPYTRSAEMNVTPTAPIREVLREEPADMNSTEVGGAAAGAGSVADIGTRAEGEIVRVRGMVVDVVESQKLPFMIVLADAKGSAKVVIGELPEPARQRLKAAAAAQEVITLDARITVYRNEKQLQPVDRDAFEYSSGEATVRPPELSQLAQLSLGLVFEVEGVIRESRYNRAGGLNGRLLLGSGDQVDFIWWSPPAWAADGSRVRGFARVGEFRGLQLELMSSMRAPDGRANP